jgi:hypothetical protein
VQGAEVALDAFVQVNPYLPDIPAGEKAQQGSGRTEIAAPESFFGDVEKNDAKKQKAEQESLPECLIQRDGAEKLGKGITDRREPETVEYGDEGRRSAGEPGNDPRSERPVEERQWVKNSNQVQGKNAADEYKYKDVIFPGQTAAAVHLRFQKLGPLKDEGKELLDSSERADPAANKSPGHKSDDNSDSRQDERGKNGSRGERCRHCQQRVEMKKDLDPADVIFSREMGDKKKIEKKAKKSSLAEDAKNLKEPVFFRPFFFQ